MVRSGDVLGRQDLGSALTSGALNPQGLGAVAGVFAEKAMIKAPISGQVIQSTAVVGEMAMPGMTQAIIADTDGLYISANVKEGYIAEVKIGQTVDVSIDAFPGRRFIGRSRQHRTGDGLHLLALAFAGRRRQLHQGDPGGAHQDRDNGSGRRAAHDRHERVRQDTSCPLSEEIDVKRTAIIPLSAAILAAAPAFPGCYASRPAGPATIKTEVAKKGRIVMDQEISGVLVPSKSLNIYAKLAGQAKTVGVEIGDRVAEGQLLVEIDTKELNAQLEVAEAAGATVRDQAAQAKIGIESARLNLDLAQKSYDRNKALFDSKAVTQSALDDAETKLELRQDFLRQRRASVPDGGRLGDSPGRRPGESHQGADSNSIITSPISGTVTNRNINVGEMTSPTLRS